MSAVHDPFIGYIVVALIALATGFAVVRKSAPVAPMLSALVILGLAVILVAIAFGIGSAMGGSLTSEDYITGEIFAFVWGLPAAVVWLACGALAWASAPLPAKRPPRGPDTARKL